METRLGPLIEAESGVGKADKAGCFLPLSPFRFPLLRRLVTSIATGGCTGAFQIGHSQMVQRCVEQRLFVLLEVAFRLRFHHSQQIDEMSGQFGKLFCFARDGVGKNA